jgi:hypothetical protein
MKYRVREYFKIIGVILLYFVCGVYTVWDLSGHQRDERFADLAAFLIFGFILFIWLFDPFIRDGLLPAERLANWWHRTRLNPWRHPPDIG